MNRFACSTAGRTWARSHTCDTWPLCDGPAPVAVAASEWALAAVRAGGWSVIQQCSLRSFRVAAFSVLFLSRSSGCLVTMVPSPLPLLLLLLLLSRARRPNVPLGCCAFFYALCCGSSHRSLSICLRFYAAASPIKSQRSPVACLRKLLPGLRH